MHPLDHDPTALGVLLRDEQGTVALPRARDREATAAHHMGLEFDGGEMADGAAVACMVAWRPSSLGLYVQRRH